MAQFPNTAAILAARPPKSPVDPFRPYALLTEQEYSPSGQVEEVATVFLTNRECPFRCLMCDLWRNTLDVTVPRGAIPAQIEWALEQLPPAKHVKLYNSGNFFDPQAIPPFDYPAITHLVKDFETVIVENHPRLCDPRIFVFQELLGPNCQLEVAVGLETIHPQVLPALNKQMTLVQFERAIGFLLNNGMQARTFILLKPPYLDEANAVDWALRSLEFAFNSGVRVAIIIPTRSGNGIMEQLAEAGEFAPPQLSSLEEALTQGLALHRGRVFVDLWDVEKLVDCAECGPRRIERLRQMNLTQQKCDITACTACGWAPV